MTALSALTATLAEGAIRLAPRGGTTTASEKGGAPPPRPPPPTCRAFGPTGASTTAKGGGAALARTRAPGGPASVTRTIVAFIRAFRAAASMRAAGVSAATVMTCPPIGGATREAARKGAQAARKQGPSGPPPPCSVARVGGGIGTAEIGLAAALACGVSERGALHCGLITSREARP